ncbi:hypothetical protein CAEBREN_08916 [Caenorhabditis brenneri]|uniref:Uncharacterized protein n=1 Tax=Caenorhabditis brenneri TaxID=135651 RepID=G0PAZ5_CAEBE|nr:hypothetical protein CAEBREN_08916 [Caenorhabditis brenneri]
MGYHFKLLEDIDCCTSVTLIFGQLVAAFFMFLGIYLHVTTNDPIFKEYLIIAIWAFCIGLPAFTVVWFAMTKVSDYLMNKPTMKRCRTRLLIWLGGTVLITFGALCPFHTGAFGSDQIAFVLSLTIVLTNVYANLVVDETPICHIKYKNNWKTCAAIVVLNILVMVAGECVHRWLHPFQPSPHPSTVMHFMASIFFGFALVDFGIALFHGVGLGKRPP